MRTDKLNGTAGDSGERDQNFVVFGIYRNSSQVELAIDTLRSNGFNAADISVLIPEEKSSHELGTTEASKSPEGATTSVSAGAAIGGTLGWLAVIGPIVLPGIGPFIAAGPIMALMAGVGSVVGGVTGGLIGWGVPEYDAKRYEDRIKEGAILLSVHCDDQEWCDNARELLESTGATEISSTSEAVTDDGESKRARTMAANH